MSTAVTPTTGATPVDATSDSTLSSERTSSLLARRRQVLSASYRLFYREPVEFVRGRGTRLYDREGREYLDAYNNVPSVGHAHPHVARAIADQAATLTTHTRYLDEATLTYAERLTERLPSSARRLTFTCTGSEAMDLALRMVHTVSGGSGIIVSRNAYHGVTMLASSFSPSLGDGVPLGEHVRVVDVPTGDPQNAGATFAAAVSDAIADLERHGIRFGALVLDSLLSSDGVHPDPAGFLRPARDVVRAAGGLYVADEVQSGFARTGEEFWGIQRHGVDPDLVVMGKAMGNGYPVAALASSSHLSEEFGARSRYFNTFGGNTTAVAAASAVLDVIDDEHLARNAQDVGSHLLTLLREVSDRTPRLGEVRGSGLFLGVDVHDEAGAAPGEGAAAVVEGLKARRILVSTCGGSGQTLKIRPPLVFTRKDAEHLVHGLADTLDHLG